MSNENTIPEADASLGRTVLGSIIGDGRTVDEEVTRKREAHTHDGKFLKDRSLFLTRMSTWSGGKAVSEEELRAAGIQDVEGYLKDHSKGSKFLVSRKSIQAISTIKSRFTADLNRITRPYVIENVRLVHVDLLDEAVSVVMKAEADLKAEVERFLAEDYDAQMEEAVRKTKERYPSLSEQTIRADFPSKDRIRARHRVVFEILPTPHQVKFSEMVNEYQLRKADEQIREYVEVTSATLRRTLIQVLEAFRDTIGSKDPDQKINSRSVSLVDKTFESFLNIAPTFGDERISQTIQACRRKFQDIQGWTREEVDSLGIDGLISEVVEAARDEAYILARQTEYLETMVAGTGDPVVQMDQSVLSGGMEMDRILHL